MSLRDQLQGIYDQYGELTPRLVIAEAADPSHPLHDRFEWDDEVAADAYRIDQAHRLIQRVKVTKVEGDNAPSVRAFQAVRTDDGYKYEPSEKVAEDPFQRKLVLADMEREWRTLKARYDMFVEFTEMVLRDIDAA